mmetsp:Transcript_4479/g.8376  ORF Transcript_4479/g.8376 Transcript_4479/m.8376 type:complete len:244 (+) Transcript_4479:773-1504(+)
MRRACPALPRELNMNAWKELVRETYSPILVEQTLPPLLVLPAFRVVLLQHSHPVQLVESEGSPPNVMVGEEIYPISVHLAPAKVALVQNFSIHLVLAETVRDPAFVHPDAVAKVHHSSSDALPKLVEPEELVSLYLNFLHLLVVLLLLLLPLLVFLLLLPLNLHPEGLLLLLLLLGQPALSLGPHHFFGLALDGQLAGISLGRRLLGRCHLCKLVLLIFRLYILEELLIQFLLSLVHRAAHLA